MMDDPRWETVRFEATVGKFSKAPGAPAQVPLAFGPQHEAEILRLVGCKATVTLEGYQTVIPTGPIEGQTTLEDAQAAAEHDAEGEPLPLVAMGPCYHSAEEVPSCPLRVDGDSCGVAWEMDPLIDEPIPSTVAQCAEAAMPFADDESAPTVPTDDGEEIPFLPTDDDEEGADLPDELEGDEVGDAVPTGDVPEPAVPIGDDSAATVPTDDLPGATVPTGPAAISAEDASALLKAAKSKGLGSLHAGDVAYELVVPKSPGAHPFLTISGEALHVADADALKIGTVAGVVFRNASGKPETLTWGYTAAPRPERGGIFSAE
jgi:hypothetical protein